MISLRINGEQKQRLDTLAEKTGRPGAFYVREALNAYLTELEYVYSLEKEAEQIRRGEIETISLEQLELECGLED